MPDELVNVQKTMFIMNIGLWAMKTIDSIYLTELLIDFGNQKIAHLLITCDGVKPKQRERKYLR